MSPQRTRRTELDEEEDELYASVEQTLEQKGVLSHMRAQLRSAVYEAILNGDGVKPDPAPSYGKIEALGAHGHTALELVVDFLATTELRRTLTQLTPEAQLDERGIDVKAERRKELSETFGLPQSDLPLLCQLIARQQDGQPAISRQHETPRRDSSVERQQQLPPQAPVAAERSPPAPVAIPPPAPLRPAPSSPPKERPAPSSPKERQLAAPSPPKERQAVPPRPIAEERQRDVLPLPTPPSSSEEREARHDFVEDYDYVEAALPAKEQTPAPLSVAAEQEDAFFLRHQPSPLPPNDDGAYYEDEFEADAEEVGSDLDMDELLDLADSDSEVYLPEPLPNRRFDDVDENSDLELSVANSVIDLPTPKNELAYSVTEALELSAMITSVDDSHALDLEGDFVESIDAP